MWVRGEQYPKGHLQRGFKHTIPWVMWWACLARDDEFDGVPAALTVLHKDRHWILPTRQRPGQWLARSLCHPHPFHTTCPKNFPHAFSCPLIDSGGERKYVFYCWLTPSIQLMKLKFTVLALVK